MWPVISPDSETSYPGYELVPDWLSMQKAEVAVAGDQDRRSSFGRDR